MGGCSKSEAGIPAPGQVISDWPYIKNRLVQYCYLARLDKPAVILLPIWPALWSLWIAAEGEPDTYILIVFIAGISIMRSFSFVVNDLADNNFSHHVSRTYDRPLPTEKMQAIEAVVLAVLMLSCALILSLYLNYLALKLCFIGLLLILAYPFMKWRTYVPQIFSSLAFSCPVLAIFASQDGNVSIIAWLIFITSALWMFVSDTVFAMVSRKDDIRVGIKSTAILFDDADRVIILSLHLIILLGQFLIGHRIDLGIFYYSGAALAAIFFAYQYYLIKDREPQDCYRAFASNQWYGATVFLALYLDYYLLP